MDDSVLNSSSDNKEQATGSMKPIDIPVPIFPQVVLQCNACHDSWDIVNVLLS
jgi:hypothetical protein